MTTSTTPDSAAPGLGAATLPEPAACHHAGWRAVTPWTGAAGTVGVAAVVGAGKMGLTLVGQFVSHGWTVTAIDVRAEVIDSINAGRSHIDEPGLDALIDQAHREGRISATADGAAAARAADVVVLIVPVMLDPDRGPDRSLMDAAVATIGPGIHAGQLIVFETTLPVGDTRRRYVPQLEAASGLRAESDFFVAFSPERLYSGAALRNLATYPKLVGAIGPRSLERAAAFYESVIDAPVTRLSSAEAAELAKLAETTYRDVNIAFANQLALVADQDDLDVEEVIHAANSQPYSHIHEPGIGVGGHCIPVYPRFLLEGHDGLRLVELARDINDGQVERALTWLREDLGSLADREVLVLGLTYRAGVKELAYSQGPTLITALNVAGARVRAFDPLLDAEEIRRLGATPWTWGQPSDAVGIVTQTNDAQWSTLDADWFPRLQILVDGRNSLTGLRLPESVRYRGFGARHVR